MLYAQTTVLPKYVAPRFPRIDDDVLHVYAVGPGRVRVSPRFTDWLALRYWLDAMGYACERGSRAYVRQVPGEPETTL